MSRPTEYVIVVKDPEGDRYLAQGLTHYDVAEAAEMARIAEAIANNRGYPVECRSQSTGAVWTYWPEEEATA
jgi:hypothetical protein